MRRRADKREPRNNYSQGILLGLSAGGLTYVVIQLFHVVSGINHINESLQQDKFKNAHGYIIVTDLTTGKKDTLLLTDYLQKKKHPPDTSTKTEIIFPR